MATLAAGIYRPDPGKSRGKLRSHRLQLVLPAMSVVLIALWLLYLYTDRIGHAADAALMRTFLGLVARCVESRGLGLEAEVVDECNMLLRYPNGTNSTWYNRQFRKMEPTQFLFNVCETVAIWEQYRNVTSLLTREYLDARPDGWVRHAAKRISQLGQAQCLNGTTNLCERELHLVLPAQPPFRPRQFNSCAVVGNSEDLLRTEFGPQIDAHDVVIRENEAPVTEQYAKHVGLKRSFRLIGRGIARNMVEVVDGSDDEVVVIKSLIHRDINAQIKELTNPVYLFQGLVFRRGAKGTGIKAVELALSMCDSVDIYGFTVDPGYSGWTRYFSGPRAGHNPLQGRAYYQLLECLNVFRIHSPMRERQQHYSCAVLPRESVSQAFATVMRLKGRARHGPLSSCRIWAKGRPYNDPSVYSGFPNMSQLRRMSNYSKWEKLGITDLREEAQANLRALRGVSLYKLDGNKLDDLLCVTHPLDP